MAEEAQAGHAAIRKDVQSDVRHRANLCQLVFERLAAIRLERDVPQQLAPSPVVAGRDAPRPSRRVEAARARSIALEMTGVDLDPLDHPGRAQPDDCPVVATAPAASGFPTVTHRAC